MPLPRLRRLLDQLDRTHHADRVRTMALLGRDHATDPALSKLLDGLAAESEYHHRLALVAAASAHDDRRLRAALTDPSPRIRACAVSNLAPGSLTVDDALATMLTGSAEDRRVLRRLVNHHGLTAVAEGMFDRVRDELGDREAAALLGACTPETVRRWLPELRYAVASLHSLATRHPVVLLDVVEAELSTLPPRRRDAVWNQIDAAVAELAVREPDRLLRLIEEVGPSRVLPTGLGPVLGAIIRFDPARVARLLVTDEFVGTLSWRLPPGLLRNAQRFETDDQVAIASALRATRQDALFFAWIGSLAPSRRSEVFTRAFDDDDRSNQVWGSDALDVLPHALRHEEARRILGRRAVQASDESTLRYTAQLPFEEARELLTSQLRRSTADERALGYQLLIACARRERSAAVMHDALAACGRLRNEQDPVRQAAMQALAACPAWLFGDRDLDQLQLLVTSAIEARDTSSAALHHLNVLAFALLADAAREPASPRFRFAISLVDQLIAPTGSISFPQLDRVLPRGAETALIDALLPRIDQAAKLDRYQLALALTRALGKRAWNHDGLQRALEAATRATSAAAAKNALSLWLENPRTRSARVAEVVDRDESTLAVHDVLQAVVRSRQDLLDVLFRKRPLKGRFLKGDTSFVPLIASGFDRWLPRQCQAYRTALDALIATSGTAEWTRAAAVRTLAVLPGIGTTALQPYLASPEVLVQEAALGGLAWTDEPGRALDELLSHAGTDRARVAVYASTRCARFVPRAELRRPLEHVLTSDATKVTAKKEAARLLGAHRPPAALDLLLDLADDPQVHRDVRIASGRTLRGFLDDDRSWRVLEAFPGRSPDDGRSLLETGPDHLAPRHRPRFATLVLAVCASDAQRVRAEALAALAGWGRWTERAAPVACGVIADLDAGTEWLAALGALTSMLADGDGWSDVAGLVQTLAHRDDPHPLHAGADRDLPSIQRLTALLGRTADLPRHAREAHRGSLLDIADTLRDRPALARGAAMIRLAAIDWSDPTPTAVVLAAGLDHRPLLSPALISALAHALERDGTSWTALTLTEPADHLIGLGTPGAGAVALQLVQSAGQRFGWPEPWRSRLRTLRSHPIEDVAVLATQVWTAVE